MQTITNPQPSPTRGSSPEPRPFRGNRRQALAMSDAECSALIRRNQDYLKNQNPRTDWVIDELFPEVCGYFSDQNPSPHDELLAKVNRALRAQGCTAVGQIYKRGHSALFGEVYRWDPSPLWSNQ